jgi:hypothetical protein
MDLPACAARLSTVWYAVQLAGFWISIAVAGISTL